MTHICNYMILRFMPYTDIGEFINVGIVMVCKTLGWFDFRMDMARARKRIKSLFPEFDMDVFKDGFAFMKNGLKYQMALNKPNDSFAMYSRFGEGQFHFSSPAGIATEEKPEKLLDDLFSRFVLGKSNAAEEKGDELLKRQLRQLICPYQWGKMYKQKTFCNSEGYEITLPFVADGLKAAKPFAFQAATYRDLVDHTILWKARFEMMDKQFPPILILAYSLPKEERQRQLATEFVTEMKSDRISCIDMEYSELLVKAMELSV